MTAPHTPATKIPLAVKMPFVTAEGKEFTDPEKLLDALGQQSGGYYLLGNNNCWHGGIHITDEKFAYHKNTYPVRCMMDGTVIAYRLNKNYPTQQWQAKSFSPSVDLKFSNGFCLIKHEYESPANLIDGQNKGKTNKLTFYSLYMHLADYHTYRADSTSTEKKAFPGYWKSSIVGKSKERMKVYRTEHACKTRTTPHDALLNEQQTVTFDGDKVKWATIHGRKLKIALCKIDDAATFAHHSRLHEGWMIVDESQVSWKHAEPSEFDDIVKCHFPITAGDPIGFMGIWESPFLAVGTDSTKTKYQMHVELFTVDDKTALDKFLNNDAKLSSGKKYLRVPKGSALYSSDGHGEFVNPHPLLNAARDYVFEESNCPQVKDKAGTVFYNIKGIRIGEMASGPIDTAYVKLEDDVKLVTQYDWKDLGFTMLEENDTHSNGYIDPEKIPSPMFQSIFKRVDGIHNKGVGDGILTGQEIQDTLQQDHALRNDLYKIIACHPSEWHRTSQDNIKKLFEEIKAKNTEEEYQNAIQFEIDRFLKCEFLSQIDGLTQKLWHFHPAIFCVNIKKASCVINAGQITYDAEGNDDSHSHYFSRVIHWPGNAESGVTIGRGYDLGNRSEEEIVNYLCESGVPSEQAEKIAKGAGKKGQDAKKFVENNKDDIKEITLDNQINLFNLIYPMYVERTVSNYNHYTSVYPDKVEWDSLDKTVKEILVDFVYQGFTRGPKPMVAGMKNNKKELIEYIKNSPTMMGYEEGRHRINYLENN